MTFFSDILVFYITNFVNKIFCHLKLYVMTVLYQFLYINMLMFLLLPVTLSRMKMLHL